MPHTFPTLRSADLRAKQNGHFARRRGDRAQVDACLRNGFVNSAAPAFGLEQVVIEIAAAHTEHTAFASAVLFQDDRDVEAHQRRSEEHTSELQSLMRISYAVFGLKKKNNTKMKNVTARIIK